MSVSTTDVATNPTFNDITGAINIGKAAIDVNPAVDGALTLVAGEITGAAVVNIATANSSLTINKTSDLITSAVINSDDIWNGDITLIDGTLTFDGITKTTDADSTFNQIGGNLSLNGETILTLATDDSVITNGCVDMTVDNSEKTLSIANGVENTATVSMDNENHNLIVSGENTKLTLDVYGDTAPYIQTLITAGNVSVDEASTLNVVGGDILNNVKMTLNGTLNISNTSNGQGTVVLNEDDTWTGKINVTSVTSDDNYSGGLELVGFNDEYDPTAPESIQRGALTLNENGEVLSLNSNLTFGAVDGDSFTSGTINVSGNSILTFVNNSLQESEAINIWILSNGEDNPIVKSDTGNIMCIRTLMSSGVVDMMSGVDYDINKHTINGSLVVLDLYSSAIPEGGSAIFESTSLPGVAQFKIDLNARQKISDTLDILGNIEGDRPNNLDMPEIDPAVSSAGQVYAISIADWAAVGDVFGKDAPIDRNIKLKIFTVEGTIQDNIIFTSTDKEILTPIGYYRLNGLNDVAERGTFDFGLSRYNPQVFRGQVATVSQYMNQLVHNDMLFDHSAIVSRLGDNDRTANLHSAIDPQFAPYQYSKKDGGLWVKAYGNFERLDMTRGLDVGNNAYGTIIGADFGVKEFSNGWEYVPTAYISYNGGHQYFNGVSIYENGGQLGYMGTFYKDNLTTAILGYAGVYDAHYSVAGNSEDTFNYFAGVASKTSYDWHLPADLILQPNLLLSYNFFGNQNWHSNYGEMGMNAGFLNGINIAPGLNFILQKETWSTYLTVNYVYNILGKVNGRAGNVGLPSVRMDHGYIQYGIGATKNFTDRLASYLQVTFRNGGRTGVGFQGGLELKF